MRDPIALLFIGAVVYDFLAGQDHGLLCENIRREEHPVLYWVYTIAGIAAPLVLVLVVIYDLTR
jgi:hypothetical protein